MFRMYGTILKMKMTFRDKKVAGKSSQEKPIAIAIGF